MENLPLELYDEILAYLPLADLARLRRVSKKFRCIVREYRIKELLSCFVWPSRAGDMGEYQNSHIIKPRNMNNVLEYMILIPDGKKDKIFLTANIFLKSGHFNCRFLRSLSCVFTEGEGAVRLSDINKLVLLERLELEFRHVVPREGNQKLVLPNLKTLLLLRCIHDFVLEVDAPKCEGFHFENHSNDYLSDIQRNGQFIRLEFKHVDSIKYLSLYRYHRKSHVFRNVEFLQINSTPLQDEEFSFDSLMDEQFFAAFPRLNTLKIMNYGSLEDVKQLFRLKNKIRGQSLKMYFHGIRLDDGSELDALQEKDFEFCQRTLSLGIHSTPAHFVAQIRNYEKLDEGLNFVTKMLLTKRIAHCVFRHFAHDPDRFIRVFDNVAVIRSKVRIQKPELFLQFLASFERLSKLTISNSGLSQSWYDRLLIHLESVHTLLLLRVEERKLIDLSFAFTFPHLGTIHRNREILKGEAYYGQRNNLVFRWPHW